MRNSQPDPSADGEGGLRFHMASKQAQVAGLCLERALRLQVGQLDTGHEGITPCAMGFVLISELFLQVFDGPLGLVQALAQRLAIMLSPSTLGKQIAASITLGRTRKR